MARPAANHPPAVDGQGSACLARATFLRKVLAATGAAALAASGATGLGLDAASGQSGDDERILNFILLLQYVEAGFYDTASSNGHLHGELAHYAQVAAAHEREHVDALRSVLGSAARAKPPLRFDRSILTDGSKFVAAAIMLEEQTLAACVGEAAHLDPARVATIARLLPVDARHAAWIRSLDRRLPAPRAADPAETPSRVLQSIHDAGLLPRGTA